MRHAAKHLRDQWMGALALFIVLAGGTAFAAGELSNNSVKSKHIANGQVKESDLAKGAVSDAQLAAKLRRRIDDLEALLAGVSRETVDGNDTLRFSGMNVQLVNGTGVTDTPNQLGNLIVGYNKQRPSTPAVRTGSHYVIVGDQHAWTSYGGALFGYYNTASGRWASVSGGSFNTASGDHSSVSGGSSNTAGGTDSSVSGGIQNNAGGWYSSVLGGSNKAATGESSCYPIC